MLPHAEVNWEDWRGRLETAGFSKDQAGVLCAIIANMSVSPAVLNCTLGSLIEQVGKNRRSKFPGEPR